MKARVAAAAAGVVGLALLSGCSSAAEDEPLFTEDQARNVGILTEADASAVDGLLSDIGGVPSYPEGIAVAALIASVEGEWPPVEPAGCTDLFVPLAIPSADAAGSDVIFRYEQLLRTTGDEASVYDHGVRHFGSIDDAKDFLADYREVVARCESIQVANESRPVRVTHRLDTSPAGLDGFSIVREVTWGESVSTYVDVYMRRGNVVAYVSGLDGTDPFITQLAETYESRLVGKFVASSPDSGQLVAQQSVTEACERLGRVATIDSQFMSDLYFGRSSEYSSLEEFSSEWKRAAESVNEPTVRSAADRVSEALIGLAQYASENDLVYPTDELTLLDDALGESLIEIGNAGCWEEVGRGWSSVGGDE